MTDYSNPTPLAVHLQEVRDGNYFGVLLIQRADNGGWALPGGYIETPLDRSAEGAAAREFREELGIIVSEGELMSSTITPAGKLLIFVRSTEAVQIDFAAWKPTPEVLAIRLAYVPEELCFPAHTDALRRWFGQP